MDPTSTSFDPSDPSQARHTLVVSDLHLADAETAHPERPLWKRYKSPDLFVDESFRRFLIHMQNQMEGPIELILNGDIFDFDSVMAIPSQVSAQFPEKISWIEKARGLFPEESKSRFKIQLILETHPIWLQAIREFVQKGNRVIFVIGNHDLELHWPSVQQDILSALELSDIQNSLVRFCEWFYISNKDTLIEHGNQYDAYCLCSNPIHPLVKKGAKLAVRLPFGNIAARMMINGIGLMNPHTTTSFIKESVWEYLKSYYSYMIRIQPLLLWTWGWSAVATLIYSLTDGFLPAVKDPFTVDVRMQDIAKRANATTREVVALKEIHAHPAIFSPVKILRELWLDRVFLFVLIILISFQFFSFINVFSQVSWWWILLPMLLLFPAFIFYANTVESEVDSTQRAVYRYAPVSAKIANVQRLVHGHTHLEGHTQVEGVEVINTGTWSPAYHDVECEHPFGKKCFAWIQPGAEGSNRIAALYEWKDSFFELIPPSH